MGGLLTAAVIAGIFVGGASTRMGGIAKGMLAAPSGEETLVERWLSVLDVDAVDEVVLVGRRDAYAPLGLPTLDDERAGIGPLGGLLSLLGHGRVAGAGKCVLAVACDMPFVSRALVARLLRTPCAAPVLAPRRAERWEPLFARYDAARVHPIALRRTSTGRHSLQALLDDAGAAELPLTGAEANELRDWDAPADLG